MSKRFEWHSYYKRMVLDNKTNKIIKVIDTLNQQAERIAELEEQLKDAEESYDKTMKYLNKTRSKLLNLVKGNKNND